jgi:phospholipase/carboxylesterase
MPDAAVQMPRATTLAATGRLSSRPLATSPASPLPIVPGDHVLPADRSGPGGIVHVPASASADRPSGLVVLLHGAGGIARDLLASFRPLAHDANVLLLAPGSVGSTWDLLVDGYGPDVARLDRALARVFARHWIEPGRVALGGFSDGATYALSLGLGNGDLFPHLVAFAPCFAVAREHVGAPRVFIAHGARDEILPVQRCSRQLVPALRARGLAVEYLELDAGHVIPEVAVRRAMTWLDEGAGSPAAAS